MDNMELSNIMVLFGGTGDLAKRKIFPALYHILKGGKLPQGFALIAVGRREKTHEEYREYIHSFIKDETKISLREELWESLAQRIYYIPFRFEERAGYEKLKTMIEEVEKKHSTQGNRIYYLAVAPEFFGIIVKNLKEHQMTKSENNWHRVVIEKPFGRNLQSAQRLNEEINQVFSEENIYRIDHYLGKEMIQNIMVLRFTNTFLEPIWNSQYIDNIQISSNEELGVDTRGEYYEDAGALRDMVQNHMMQLLTLTAMEPPVKLNTRSIGDEKIRVLRSLEEYTQESIAKNIVRGQYSQGVIKEKEVKGYRQEDGVDPVSSTETFVAMKMAVENYRWAGVPFYIRTGKRMPKKSTEIVVEFKRPPEVLFFKEYKDLQPNLLIIGIQPGEGASLRINAKKPGMQSEIIPVEMDYCQNCNIEDNSPEAYERLIHDVMRGDSTLFTRWDEVECSWRIVDNISAAWGGQKEEIIQYPAGNAGPLAAKELLERDHKKWWNDEGEHNENL